MMRRGILIAILWLVAWTSPAWTQGAPVTFETITVSSTAVGLATTTYSPTGRGQMTTCTARLETAQVRFRFDGTAPTSTVGFLLEDGDVLTIERHDHMRLIKFIRTTGADATLSVHCWQ